MMSGLGNVIEAHLNSTLWDYYAAFEDTTFGHVSLGDVTFVEATKMDDDEDGSRDARGRGLLRGLREDTEQYAISVIVAEGKAYYEYPSAMGGGMFLGNIPTRYELDAVIHDVLEKR